MPIVSDSRRPLIFIFIIFQLILFSFPCLSRIKGNIHASSRKLFDFSSISQMKKRREFTGKQLVGSVTVALNQIYLILQTLSRLTVNDLESFIFLFWLFLGTQWNRCMRWLRMLRTTTDSCRSVRSRWCTTRRMDFWWRISSLAFHRWTNDTRRRCRLRDPI